MNLPLDPKLALANLPFGLHRDQVKRFFGGEPTPFCRTQADQEGYFWPTLGVFAYFDDADGLEGLELAAPANPSIAGTDLTSLTIQQAKQLLKRFDNSLDDEGSAATSKALGIAIWTGSGSHGVVQAVMRFAPGYYD
jgi:hypothetical protein